jgi:hypothetical protein
MRWRRRRPDPAERLISDIARTRGLMRAVIASARRLEVEIPLAVTASIESWRSWEDQLAEPDQ